MMELVDLDFKIILVSVSAAGWMNPGLAGNR